MSRVTPEGSNACPDRGVLGNLGVQVHQIIAFAIVALCRCGVKRVSERVENGEYDQSF